MKLALVTVGLLAIACGGKRTPVTTTPVDDKPRITTAADRVLPLLPLGVQLILEVDLARLRANPVVGAIVAKAFEPGGRAPEKLGSADAIVLAAYGLGTSEAATLTILVAKAPIPETVQIADGIYALGTPDWIAQLEARAALAASGKALTAPKEMLALRDHAIPEGAPGASLRVTARLPFDARIALARITGLESAPAQLSVWGDVVDDLAIIVDADSADPGEKQSKKSAERLTHVIRGALGMLASDPTIRALGLPSSLANAKLVVGGTWVRTIITVGPKHLMRVVDRANAQSKGSSPP